MSVKILLLTLIEKFSKTCDFCLIIADRPAGMEISGSPFARGDQIYQRANGFRSIVARLANCLDQVTEITYLRRRECLNGDMKLKWNMNNNELM